MSFTKKALQQLHRKGAIKSNPPGEDDLDFLERLERVWGDTDLLRMQLSKYPSETRKRIIDTSEFSSKWEVYAYGRFLNNKLAYGRLGPRLDHVFNEVKSFFPSLDAADNPDEYIRARLKQIQRKARRKRADMPLSDNSTK